MQIRKKMKFRNKVFVSFLAFASLCFVGFSKKLNQDIIEEAKVRRSLAEQEFKNFCTYSIVQDLFTFSDQLEIIEDLVKPKHGKLVLILADDVKDAITLAETLSENNRVLPEKNREDLSHSQKTVYDAVLETYYLYEEKVSSTHMFVYPRNMKNETLATYIAKKVLDSAEKIRIILTDSDLKLRIYRMFEAALEVFKDVNANYNRNIIFLPTNLRNITYHYEIIEEYSNLPNLSINQKVLAIYALYHNYSPLLACDYSYDKSNKVLCNYWIFINSNYAIKSKSDFRNHSLSLDGTETLRCFFIRVNTVMQTFTLDEMRSNMSTLTGVFTLSENLDKGYRGLSSFIDCVNGTLQFDKCVENLCNNVKQLEIITLFCFTKYMTNVITADTETWISVLELYTKNKLQFQQAWYMRLKSTYYNVNYWNETDILLELQDLYQEISTIGYQLDRDIEIMKNAYNTIKANTIKMQAIVSCSKIKNGYKLQVKGNFLKFGEILSENYCNGLVRIIEIFALEKIIIDQNLIKVGEEIQVIIFAPIWEVIGDKIINLDGVSRNLSEYNLAPKARNGDEVLNRNGAHGHAGLAGGPAGTFYGIGGTFIGGEHLRISSNGGNGSSGQDGGDGIECVIITTCNNDGYCHKYSAQYSPNGSLLIGGRGGNGGIAGKGSKQNDIKLFPLNESDNISIRLSAMNGTNGKSGIGGKGGKFLKDGENIFVPFDQDPLKFFDTVGISQHGRNGSSTIGYKLPKKKIILEDFAQATNHYKHYILSSMLANNKYSNLYKQLNSNKNIQNAYYTLAFVEELTDLEEHYYKQKNKSSSLFLFKSWRERIREYHSHRKENEKSNDFTKVLFNLDNMISKKIKKLEENFYDHSILLIENYLKKCIAEITKLQDVEVVVKMNSIGSEFIKEFENEIEEARRLIEDELQVNVEAKNDELSSEIECLLDKIMDLIKSKTNKLEELNKKKHEIRNKMKLKFIYSVFQVLSTALAFINSVCAGVGATLAAGSIHESIIVNFGDRAVPAEIAIPKAVSDSVEFITNSYDEIKTSQKLIIERNLNLIKEKKEALQKAGEDAQPLVNIEISIRNLQNILNSTKLLETYQVKLMENVLREEEEIWKKKSSMKGEIYEKSLKLIHRLKTTTVMVEAVGDSYAKYLRDEAAMDQLSEVIEETSNSLQQLQNYKENVYSKMIPIIEQIREKVVQKTGEFAVSSITYLEFQKWKTDEYLGEVSSQIETWTKDFEAEASFKSTIKKLGKAMQAMINVHTRINDYIQKMKFAKYLSELSIVPFEITNTKNVKLSTALAKMIQAHYANDILDEYNKWMNSFMQYTFPFANEFLDVYKSPISEVDELLSRGKLAVEEMTYLKSQIEKRKAQGQILNKISTAKFGNDGSLPPFYVWNSSTHLSNIKDILKGKEVQLFANISEQKNLNGIKFNEIEVLFTSTDVKINSDLQRDLEGFSVILTHNGDSYYRCDDKVYLISSGAHEFSKKLLMSRGKHSNNEASSYEFINNNCNDRLDYVLSPFATWTIRLVNILGKKEFNMLGKYATDINIELVGEGQYSYSNLDVCKSNLTEYYEKEILFHV